MPDFDAVVVGAGVIGLAIGRRLGELGLGALVLERAGAIGHETSSRNSEVIHSGVYYPTRSKKARFCVTGREALYAYCQQRGIPFRRCGKLIVACSASEVSALTDIRNRALDNGVNDVQWLSQGEANALEPQVSCIAALWLPCTGIIDSHTLMHTLRGDLESLGGNVLLHTAMTAAQAAQGLWEVETNTSSERSIATTRWLINAAGLWATEVAGCIDGLPPAMIPHPYFAKGNYFTLGGIRPFTRLVYPLPDSAGLGIHATIDLTGAVRFGPDVQWVDAPRYDLDGSRVAAFYESIRKYYPALPDGSLQPAYAGVRPKIVGPGAAAADFRIDGPLEHGMAGLVNLFGIESPGLTSCLAIADHVADKIVQTP